MPDDVAILRWQAAKLTDAAMIAVTRGKPKLAGELRELSTELASAADEQARPHQWTGSHPGDTAGP